MSVQQEQFTRFQAAVSQLSGPPSTTAVLYPGPERYAMITFLLQKMLSPEMVHQLQQRVLETDLPAGLAAEEAQAHRLSRALHAVDVQATADQVRGCTSQEDSLRLLNLLASLAVSQKQNLREAAAAAAAAATTTNCPAPNSRPLSPALTPRQRTPTRSGGGAHAHDSSSGGRVLLNLQSVDGELRLLDSLAERLPQLLDTGGGSSWFPTDIMAAAQSYMTNQPLQEVTAAVEQRAQRLRQELPVLRAEEARLAAEVTMVSEADWERQAEATRAELAELLETSTAFYHTFQTGLGVWCAASKAADTCGLGPLASELLQRYEAIKRLGAELARIRQAHTNIVSCAPPITLLEQHTLSQLVRAAQAAMEHLRARIALEQRVMTEAEVDMVRAVAVARMAGMAQPLVAQPTHG
ncbi:hypothetical protein Agub_g3118 [Astrephomene gubernaculifera]|uniref:Uncharacterized protein n=1 Tax=Astrephomene gubernaculifera TaxID=47775 RepID=A0AAD3DI27_9CHLO|nr:hypothetical protein Agub_g3118 [Astrephomene gubernaculifera]